MNNGEPLPAPARRLPLPLRLALLLLAVCSLALGIIGIFVPGLPTTVFILIAAWAAARSSPRLSAWLQSHRQFGPLLRDWRDGGKVSRRAKCAAALMMAVCAILLFLTRATWLASSITALMGGVLLWLWRRPEP